MDGTINIESYVRSRAKSAAAVARRLYTMPAEEKNSILLAMADHLNSASAYLQKENEKDITAARTIGLSNAMIDRLMLNSSRIAGMVKGLRDVAMLPDPVGEIASIKKMPSGIRVGQLAVPIGVIGIIYESRPNVTADAAGLCIKSGNAVLLRGGSEAIHSNTAIVKVMNEAAANAGCPDIITFFDITDRQTVSEMIKADRYIDLIIPRGGEGLIRAVVEGATVPVIKHFKGLCHAYVDRYASMDMALDIVENSKVQRPGVCNALETLLVHKAIAPAFLPELQKRLDNSGVELRGCTNTMKILSNITGATTADWDAEYLDLVLSVRIVQSMTEAVEHIDIHGSSHTETIITDNYERAMRFINEVDSSAVMVNASTRFNDGGEFGLGAEIGISTSKLHVRGPMGLKNLVCSKYIVLGNGEIRQ